VPAPISIALIVSSLDPATPLLRGLLPGRFQASLAALAAGLHAFALCNSECTVRQIMFSRKLPKAYSAAQDQARTGENNDRDGTAAGGGEGHRNDPYGDGPDLRHGSGAARCRDHQ